MLWKVMHADIVYPEPGLNGAVSMASLSAGFLRDPRGVLRSADGLDDMH